MQLDFALIITTLTLVAGVIWTLDRFWLRKRRADRV